MRITVVNVPKFIKPTGNATCLWLEGNKMSKHSTERGSQRYNIFLSEKDEHNIIEMINNDNCYHLEPDKRYKDRNKCYVVYKHIPLKLVYATNNKGFAVSLVTMLPFDVEEFNEIIKS